MLLDSFQRYTELVTGHQQFMASIGEPAPEATSTYRDFSDVDHPSAFQLPHGHNPSSFVTASAKHPKSTPSDTETTYADTLCSLRFYRYNVEFAGTEV